MQNAGSALMAIGYGTGETRCIDAAKDAISSPLLETSIEGATGVLYNITGSSNLTLTETSDAAEIIRAAVDEDAEIIYGTSIDDSMGDSVMITLIATGFSDRQSTVDFPPPRRQQRGYQQRERGGFRIAAADGGSRPPHQSPILPDDDFEEESSIIRFLRER
jgi:cell division protein FtsZ